MDHIQKEKEEAANDESAQGNILLTDSDYIIENS